MADERRKSEQVYHLIVPGRRVAAVAATREGASEPLARGDEAGLGEFAADVRTHLAAAVEVSAARAGAEPLEVEAAADELVELELEGGVLQWLTVERLAELAERPASRGGLGGAATAGDGDRRIVLPPALRFGAPTRGGGELLLRGLRVIGVDVAGEAAQEIARRLENRLEPGPGLYRFRSGRPAGPPLAPGELAGGGPFLVFLHGTASTTTGSFSALAAGEEPRAGDSVTPEWRRLGDAYGDRVLALQHRTLSESPVENALDLLHVLPAGADLHLVSHSRGGLIGELLCRGARGDGRDPFTRDELEAFLARGRRAAGRDRTERAAREAEHERLRTLARELKAKRPRVERFVRVACPARGTVLASRRLDRSLTLILNAIGLVPALAASPTYRFTKALLLALAKKRAEPAELPGLEAMMPESPFVALLNTGAALASADLRVIAGDLQGTGFAGRLKTFATDLFFRQDHDLVVDTGAMFAGVRRTAGRSFYFFDRGGDVSHFRYFANPHSRRRVVDGLLAPPPATPPGFQPLRAQDGVVPPASERGAGGRVSPETLDAERPVVVVLPGIMGSHLAADGDFVWLDYDDLAAGGIERLEVDAPKVAATELLAASYGGLIRYLSASHQVVPFPFDWRLSLDDAAKALAAELRQVLDRVGQQPVRFLAHSMGGLVVRRLRTEHRTLWKRLAARQGFRFVMLGTPNGGSWTIPAILLGQERVLRMLALLDFAHGRAGWVDRVRRFPGLLEMMPVDAAATLFEKATWESWGKLEGLASPTAGDLAAAKAFRRGLDGDEIAAGEPICYVAGRAPLTPKGVTVVARGGRKRAVLVGSPAGDGRVLWETGIPANVPAWFTDVAHGSLPSVPRLFPAFLDLLVRGATDLLGRTEPAGLRGAADVELPLPEEDPVLFPDLPDLEAAAVGAEAAPGRAPEERPLRVSVVHGDAAFSRHPVVVGHYEGDVIASVESVLDGVLGGALTRCHQLGLYPGRVGTARVFLAPGEPSSGAVITGLGEVGDLTPGEVQLAMRHATLAYAFELASGAAAAGDAASAADGEERRELALSVVLVGTGHGSGMGIDDSIRALVRGTVEAELKLRSLEQPVRVAELEILELFDDRAMCAAAALRRLATRDDFAGVRIEAVHELEERTGAQERTTCPSEGGWWRRLKISHDAEGVLTFLSLTERARAPVTLVPTQERLVDGFVRRSVGSSAWQPEQAATLFELLVPRELKAYAPDDRDLLLVVDQSAARFPWELMVDGLGGGEPLAVRAGMLRQLATPTWRHDVVTPVGDLALVVGDPPTGDPVFPPLAGARAEATAVVAELAARDWTVEAEIGSRPESVVQALFTRGYRLIHVAAHGVHRRDSDDLSGVVLGDGILLSPRELSQMRRVPELVFVNCCHLGSVDRADHPAVRGRNELAASFGVALIEMGVRAAVVAGWAVDDAAADTFARTFYREMLAGAPFGDAVRAARSTTFRRHPAVNTWGAYQCYGDPEYRLRLREAERARARPDWVTPRSPVGELDNLCAQARVGRTGLRPRLEEIDEHLERQHAAWLSRSDLRMALGSAWGEIAEAELAPAAGGADPTRALECYDRALEHLDQALAGGDEELEVGTSVLRSYVALRRLLATWRSDPEAAPPVAEVRRLIRGLEATVRAVPTHWGRTTLAVAYRKLAAMEADPEKRRQALEKAVERYGDALRALDRTRGRSPQDRRNGLIDLIVASALALLSGLPLEDERRQAIEGWVQEAQQRPAGMPPSFWAEELEAEAKLARLLWQRAAGAEPAESAEDVARAYRAALRGPRSPRQAALSLEVLDSVVETLAGSTAGPAAAALTDLRQVREQVRKLVAGR